MVVEEEAEADEPGRPLLRRVRQHEAHRPDDVRRRAQQHLALDQRLAHQPELVIFEIAQAAMDQLAAARRGALARDRPSRTAATDEAAPGRVARDAGAVDAAADDERGRRLPAAIQPCCSLRFGSVAAVLVWRLRLGPRAVALERAP